MWRASGAADPSSRAASGLPSRGGPDIEVLNSQQGVVATAGTPKPVLAKLNAEMQRFQATPEFKEQLVKFAKENHAKFAIVWDKDHSAAEKYDLRSLTMPSSFVIDKTGTVRHVHKGFKDGEEAQIAEEIKALIK